MKLHIYEAHDGFRWRLVSRNGRIVADSGEAYASRSKARQGFERILKAAATASITFVNE